MSSPSSLADQFIEAFGTVISESSQEMKFICPECRHKGLYANKSTGLFHCFHCGFKGKKEGLAEVVKPKLVDVDLQLRMLHVVINECTLDKGHRKYLLQRGIYHPEIWGICTIPNRILQLLLSKFSSQQLEDAGLVHQTARGAMTAKFLEPRRILIPFWSGDTLIGAKSRNNPFDPDANPDYKYLASPGAKIGSSIFHKGKLEGDFILTEGELKAIVATEEGFTVGATSGMIPSASVLSQISRLVNSRQITRFFIAYDSSPSFWTNVSMLKSLYKLTSLCSKKACIVEFPLEEGQTKEDLDSYLIKNGAGDFDYLLELSWSNRHNTQKQLRDALNRYGILNGHNQIRTQRSSSNSANKA
jgi:predicted RNA-binding Zn-ribbon protein involved in translation (DUF1610 family)